MRRMLTQSFDKRRKYGKRPELSNFSARKVLASERIGPLRAEISPPATSDSTLDHDKGNALDLRKMPTQSFDKRRKYGKRPELSNFSARKVLASERIGPLRAEISPPATSDSTLDHDKGNALDPRKMPTHFSVMKSRSEDRGLLPLKN
ncbi:MAG: hypothetical protein ACI4UV_18310 [Victivallales bacterium]